MKKIGALLLALVLVIGLTACGDGGKSDDPNVGTWKAVTASMLGINMAIADLFEGDVTLELRANGRFQIDVNGDRGSGKWEYSGDTLKFTASGVDMTGTVTNGTLALTNLLGMGIDLTLEKVGGYQAGISIPVNASAKGGYFKLDYGIEDGETITGDELRAYGLDYFVILNEDGTLVFQLDHPLTGTWKDGIISLIADGETMELPYTLEGDEFTTEMEGLTMVFLRSSETPPSVQIEETPPADGTLSALQAWWDGHWYGYWAISGVTDGYRHLDDGRWDCYAVIEMNPDDTGMVYLWDDENAIATTGITVSADGGSGSMGSAISESGTYWDGAKIGHGDWIIDPSLYGYEDYMVIDGYYDSATDPGEGFYYWAYLRPWGRVWNDIPADERPPWYKDWYLENFDIPMLQAITQINDGAGFIHPGVAGGHTGAGLSPGGASGGSVGSDGTDAALQKYNLDPESDDWLDMSSQRVPEADLLAAYNALTPTGTMTYEDVVELIGAEPSRYRYDGKNRVFNWKTAENEYSYIGVSFRDEDGTGQWRNYFFSKTNM